jgi:hypothetical protein
VAEYSDWYDIFTHHGEFFIGRHNIPLETASNPSRAVHKERAMRPVRVEKARFEQTTDVMLLDDPEMTLSLLDLEENRAAIVDVRYPVQPTGFPDLRAEYASAASLVFDRAEAEAIALELALALREHPVAA